MAKRDRRVSGGCAHGGVLGVHVGRGNSERLALARCLGRIANSISTRDRGRLEIEEYLAWGFIAKRFSRSVVKAIFDPAELGEHGSVAGALAAFDATRRPDVNGLQRLRRWVTPLFQSDSRIVAALREQSVLAIGHSDALKRHAMATLCKIPRGLAVAT